MSLSMKRAFFEWSLLLSASLCVASVALWFASRRPEWSPSILKLGSIYCSIVDGNCYLFDYPHFAAGPPQTPQSYAIVGEDKTGSMSLPGMILDYLRTPRGNVTWRLRFSVLLPVALSLAVTVICLAWLLRWRKRAKVVAIDV
jgi:hypothetical protein